MMEDFVYGLENQLRTMLSSCPESQRGKGYLECLVDTYSCFYEHKDYSEDLYQLAKAYLDLP